MFKINQPVRIYLFALLLLPLLTNAKDLPVSNESRLLSDSYEDYLLEMMSGGPGKDGIPSVDKPQFWTVREANTFLDDKDIVFGVYHNGVAKAYPQRIMVWHEIVNDTVGGKPLSISYCPLTATAIGFERGSTELGVSGNLINSNMVMYDRETDSLWPQIAAVAIDGAYQGKSLAEHRVFWTSWARWKQRHPDTQVLSDQTGHIRNYQRDPYGDYNPLKGYYLKSSPTMFPVMHSSSGLAQKSTILGFRTANSAVAVKMQTLRIDKVVQVTQDDVVYIIIYDQGLDTGWVYQSNTTLDIDVSQIPFEKTGPNAEVLNKLPAINAFKAMWFAWKAYYPKTQLY
ncbi:MAG: DUF3179 domain-containing protein [Gammaproteobacteria bacterium]|nr:DUF3179 domain-containing protein [Gammaproteobacteria bacterium]MDT8371284.1 DUF3179 domain-containing protein [Gammaproteobacteria bacterium]